MAVLRDSAMAFLKNQLISDCFFVAISYYRFNADVR